MLFNIKNYLYENLCLFYYAYKIYMKYQYHKNNLSQ